MQIAVYIATGAEKTIGGRSAKDRPTAFSNSYGDAVAISGRFIPLLSPGTWQHVSACLSVLPKCVASPRGGKRVKAAGQK